MKAANDSTLRVLADGLIHMAECQPKGCDGGRLLREAAGNLLDAEAAIERFNAGLLATIDQQNQEDAA